MSLISAGGNSMGLCWGKEEEEGKKEEEKKGEGKEERKGRKGEGRMGLGFIARAVNM